jgi:protein-S-isoprenylcysteine O-methyltransferase Ste14
MTNLRLALMPSLEHRIPPPVVLLLAGLLMWLVDRGVPLVRIVVPAHIALAVVIALIGTMIVLAGLIEFRRARTTIDPLHPNAASSLVSNGVYTFTRNPMYLGILTILTAWAVYLSNLGALVVLPLFVAYMNRFQIVPEERALEALFGAEYRMYKSRVRRWL